MQISFLHIVLAFILLGSTTCLKIFLLGGAVPDTAQDVYTAMIKQTGRIPQPYNCDNNWDTTTCPRVAVITSAAQNQQQGNYYYGVDQRETMCFRKLFQKYGCSPKHVTVHRDNYQKTTDVSRPQGKMNQQILKKADIIFFDGGDQIRHSLCWLTEQGVPIPLFELIMGRARADKVILGGTSAGTMIWSNPAYGGGSSFGHLYFSQLVGLAPKKISDGAINGSGMHDTRNGTSGLQYQQNGAIFQGFGQLPFLLDTHFDVRGRLGRIIPAQIQTKTDIGIGIDQPACLYYNNGVSTVYGKGGVFISDITKANRNPKQYFTVNNVIVSYLTAGDVFTFADRVVHPSSRKHPITQPQYKTHYDSNDILSAYECTQSLTRLVDQTPGFNIGRTKKLKGFPASTPTFRLTFDKGVQTTGFYSTPEKTYTVNRALLHFTYE